MGIFILCCRLKVVINYYMIYKLVYITFDALKKAYKVF